MLFLLNFQSLVIFILKSLIFSKFKSTDFLSIFFNFYYNFFQRCIKGKNSRQKCGV